METITVLILILIAIAVLIQAVFLIINIKGNPFLSKKNKIILYVISLAAILFLMLAFIALYRVLI